LGIFSFSTHSPRLLLLHEDHDREKIAKETITAMDFSVGRNDLIRELQLVQGIVERKTSIPVLANVLIEASSGRLRILATDLDVSVRCGCEANVTAEGALTLSAKKLYEIVRALPEEDVRVRLQSDSWVIVDCGRATFRVAGLPREDFPSLPEAAGRKRIELAAATLRALIARTAFAVTTEDARYYLAGALLIMDKDAVSMVATDGHRLAYAQSRVPVKGGDGTRVLVPRKAIHELGKLLEGQETVAFQQLDNHLVFAVGERVLASKTIEGQFPAFEKVVAATTEKAAKVGRDALALALRRVSLLSSERSRAVKVGLSTGVLELSASSPDVGEARETLPVEYDGQPVEIGFNAQYLLDFLGAAGAEAVMLALRDAESQGTLRPLSDEIDYRYIVMPMRL
jgi:DNA polymerase III subunit beta